MGEARQGWGSTERRQERDDKGVERNRQIKRGGGVSRERKEREGWDRRDNNVR